VDLLVRALEHEIGEAIDPRGLHILYGAPSPEVTEEQLAEAVSRAALLTEARYAHFSLGRAVIMAAWMFPVLRPALAENAIPGWGAKLRDPVQLRELGQQAMDDDDWEICLAEIQRKEVALRVE